MSRIAYKSSDRCWLDSQGLRKDVFLPPDETDYYYIVDDLKIILRFFDESSDCDEALGIIYNFNGEKIKYVPAFCPSSYSGVKKFYKSRVSWVQSYKEGLLTLIISGTGLKEFRAILDLEKVEFIK